MECTKLDIWGDAETESTGEDYVGADLKERFEVWHKGQLVLMVDIHEDTFVVEWHTRKTVRGFVSESKELMSYDGKLRVSCMLSEGDEDKYLSSRTLPVINSRQSYPDNCTYMEVDPDDEDIAVAWSEGTPHPTITMRGHADSLDRLGSFAELTIVDREFSNEEIENIIWKSIDKIDEELNSSQNNSSGSSILDRLHYR